jgi:hypothetical protein
MFFRVGDESLDSTMAETMARLGCPFAKLPSAAILRLERAFAELQERCFIEQGL